MHLKRLHYKTGAMKNHYRCSGINKTLSLMFYTFWFFLQADGETILAVAGSTVTLKCNNESISTLRHLEWKMNIHQKLVNFIPKVQPVITDEAHRLNITMSDSESQLYALIIKRAQDSHIGNYTCTTTTATGVWQKTSELLITADTTCHTYHQVTLLRKAQVSAETCQEPEGITNRWSTLLIAVTATVSGVCVLIFIISLAIALKVRRRGAECAENSIYSLAGDVHGEPGDIYENCLENRSYSQQSRHKSRTHR